MQELFKVTSGHSLFGVVNGKCVNDPKSKASDINSNSLLGLEIATNRDIIGITLANLIVSFILVYSLGFRKIFTFELVIHI